MDMIPDYCRNKHNPKLTTYDHPLLEPILKNTYGQIVYQEQVMDIFKFMGGYSLGQADMVRRAMGKKDLKEMAKQRDIFVNGNAEMNIKGAIANGVQKSKAVEIFDKMEKFAGYAFNKSHAACYAYISYQTAYLKHHYYPYYMASVLNNRVHKWDDMTRYIISMRAKGLEILPPDINKSKTYFAVEDGGVRFGLGAIKNIGVGLVESILQERNKGDFIDFHDFMNRVPADALNKKCLDSLILSGALDCLGPTRSQMIAIFPMIVSLIQNEKKATDAGQISLFGTVLKNDSAAQIKMPNIAEYDSQTKSRYEREVLGIYLSGHPLDAYLDILNECTFNAGKIKNEDEELEPGQPVSMLAVVSDFKKMQTKSTKQDMAVMQVEDLYGGCEVMLFPKIFDRHRRDIVKNAIVKITGKLSIRDGEDAIILADRLEFINPDGPATIQRESTLVLKYNSTNPSINNEIKKILTDPIHSGNMRVIVECTTRFKTFPAKARVSGRRNLLDELVSVLGEHNVEIKE